MVSQSRSELVCYRGSQAHGTYIPSYKKDSCDDIDIMGITIPPIDNYFGLSEWGSRGTINFWEGEWDCVFYEMKKFLNLLCKANPNVLTMLWCRKEYTYQYIWNLYAIAYAVKEYCRHKESETA